MRPNGDANVIGTTLIRACVCAASLALVAGCAGQSSRWAGDDGFDAAVDRPPTPRTLLMMARLLIGEQRHAEAEYVLERIVSEEPAYLPAWADLAELQLQQRRMDEAVATLQRAIEISPADAVLRNNLGMALLQRHDTLGALAEFASAAQSDPHEARYQANYAMALALAGRYEESLEAYLEVVPPAQALYNVGVLSESRGDAQQAALVYGKAAELGGPSDSAGALARVRADLGEIDEP